MCFYASESTLTCPVYELNLPCLPIRTTPPPTLFVKPITTSSSEGSWLLHVNFFGWIEQV